MTLSSLKCFGLFCGVLLSSAEQTAAKSEYSPFPLEDFFFRLAVPKNEGIIEITVQPSETFAGSSFILSRACSRHRLKNRNLTDGKFLKVNRD